MKPSFVAAKEPDIGTPEWFSLMSPEERELATRLVTERRPVIVYRNDKIGEWLYSVAFVDTTFWAGAFKLAGRARAYAARWNKQCEEKEAA